jgi:broad specificity phosphatase PhoE
MIYFVRHGESEANIRKVFAGRRDNSLLTQKGKEEAKLTGQKIREREITDKKYNFFAFKKSS